MYCSNCNRVYKTEDDVCPFCASKYGKVVVKKDSPNIKVNLLKSIRAGGISCLLWLIVLGVIIVFRKTVFKEIPNDRQVDNTIFMYALLFNTILIPITLSIYNLIINIKT